MENRIAIRKATELAKGKTGTESFIELEDSYFKYLADLIRTNRWGFWHEDLLTFKDDVLAVK